MSVLSVIPMGLLSGMLLVSAVEQTSPASIVRAARAQIGRTVRYDPGYRTLDYPSGDVPMETGVCTDVVVRALRNGIGLDLQKLVYEDMKGNFSRYPQNWGLTAPDRNIDHRRVPNLQTYFRRCGWELPPSMDHRSYRAGDLVTCVVPPRLPHIMIVSDRISAAGRPLVIHNIGAGAQEEDRLFDFRITGHYRIRKLEPDGRANRSQPTRPATSRGSGSAGSGR